MPSSGAPINWMETIIAHGYKGQRFTGCGLARDADGVRIDVYDSPGDYLASGIDGAEIYVHGNAQDQVGQIMKRGSWSSMGCRADFHVCAKGGRVLSWQCRRPAYHHAVGRRA